MVPISPQLLAALIGQVAVPELLRWLSTLHQQGKTVITEEDALKMLNTNIDKGNAAGEEFLRQLGGG